MPVLAGRLVVKDIRYEIRSQHIVVGRQLADHRRQLNCQFVLPLDTFRLRCA